MAHDSPHPSANGRAASKTTELRRRERLEEDFLKENHMASQW
ncbi:hypothetical protein ACU8KH_04095 [Lachancea thermotolerans]